MTDRYIVTQRWFNRRATWNGVYFSMGAPWRMDQSTATSVARELQRDHFRNVTIAKLSIWQWLRYVIWS